MSEIPLAQPLAQTPRMKPNKQNETLVSTRNSSIAGQFCTSYGTKSRAVHCSVAVVLGVATEG